MITKRDSISRGSFFLLKLEVGVGTLLQTCLLKIDNLFFPDPLAFCKKAVERVNSEKNILNSSVECVEWSGFF